MRRRALFTWAAWASLGLLAAGCSPGQKHYLRDGDVLAEYIDQATHIEEPIVDHCRLADVEGSIAPVSTWDEHEPQKQEISEQEAVQTALANSKILRLTGSGDDFILRNPTGASTIYDPALAESSISGGQFGSGGVESALADFDAQVSTSMFWGKSDEPQNFDFGLFQPPVITSDTGTFQAGLSKVSATGAQYSVTAQTDYLKDNRIGSRLFPSSFTQTLGATVRQPLLRGAGAKFNRIAGPGATPGFYRGVAIARINTDISLADFEANVRNLVSDTENTYWDLYCRYREVDALKKARDAFQELWQKEESKLKTGGGGRASEARSRQRLYDFQTRLIDARRRLLLAEAQLRYVIGIASTDGRLLYPSDEPTEAKTAFDWHESHLEALSLSAELRRQKWVIKQTELALCASKNFLLPQLDAVAQYNWVGLGDRLIHPDGQGQFFDGAGGIVGSDAWSNLTQGDHQQWQLGLQLNMPLGFRREMAAVRNMQLRLARERAMLQDQELVVVKLLTDAVNNMNHYYESTRSNFNRYVAAKKEHEVFEAAYKEGVGQLENFDVLESLLNARAEMAQAELGYYTSLCEHTKQVIHVHFRKGTLLDWRSISLSEGPWPCKAYFDAREKARCRAASLHIDYGISKPAVFSEGPVARPIYGHGDVFESLAPTEAPPEVIPSPQGEPTEAGELQPTSAQGARPVVRPAAATAPAAAAPAEMVAPATASTRTNTTPANAAWTERRSR